MRPLKEQPPKALFYNLFKNSSFPVKISLLKKGTLMTSKLSTEVLQDRKLDKIGDFQTALQQVSNLRYSLIDERNNRIPNLPEPLPRELQKQQELYTKVIRECQGWEWTCQGHLSNPKSDRCFRETAISGFPSIQKQVKSFYQKRKMISPEDPFPRLGRADPPPALPSATEHKSRKTPSPEIRIPKPKPQEQRPYEPVYSEPEISIIFSEIDFTSASAPS